jgi:hypothetical protein
MMAAAHMLAAVMWETTSPMNVSQMARNRKDQPLRDKNKQPVMVSQRKWLIATALVSEVGQDKGWRSHEPWRSSPSPPAVRASPSRMATRSPHHAAGVMRPVTHQAPHGQRVGRLAVTSTESSL